MPSHTAHQMNPQRQRHLEECIRLCLDCARVCEQCGAECIGVDMRGMSKCIDLCRDCAAICWLDAQLMSRNSPFHFQICGVSAEICEACAAECERMAVSHEGELKALLQHCADICRRCAEACRQMAAMTLT